MKGKRSGCRVSGAGGSRQSRELSPVLPRRSVRTTASLSRQEPCIIWLNGPAVIPVGRAFTLQGTAMAVIKANARTGGDNTQARPAIAGRRRLDRYNAAARQ